MTTFEELKKKKAYVALPWKINPNQSFKNATDFMMELRIMGFVPFSPVNHTHHYWKELKGVSYYEIKCSNSDCETGIIRDSMKPTIQTCAICGSKIDYLKEPKSSKIQTYLENEDWLEWDLDLLKGFMKNDGGFKVYFSPKVSYDSGIFMVLSNTAFTDILDIKGQRRDWHSKGCEIEFNFAKQNHIQIFELQSFLKRILKEV